MVSFSISRFVMRAVHWNAHSPLSLFHQSRNFLRRQFFSVLVLALFISLMPDEKFICYHHGHGVILAAKGWWKYKHQKKLVAAKLLQWRSVTRRCKQNVAQITLERSPKSIKHKLYKIGQNVTQSCHIANELKWVYFKVSFCVSRFAMHAEHWNAHSPFNWTENGRFSIKRELFFKGNIFQF